MKTKDIEMAAHNIVARRIAEGQVVQMAWAVQELINGQGEISGKGVEFYQVCSREHAYRVIKKVVSQYEEPENNAAQMEFGQFSLLQAAYTVERDGQRQIVPVDMLAVEELLARAADFEKKSKTLSAHADDIRKYVKAREALGRKESA